MKFIFKFCLIHSMKIGYVICILLAFMASFSDSSFMEGKNWFLRFIVLAGILAGTRLFFGGWNARTLKSMVWSVILSTIGGVGLVISGMKSDGGSVSFWICCIPVIIALVSGIGTYHFIDNNNDIEIDESALIDSLFDNGLKNTWNSLFGEFESMQYSICSKAVAIYSNVCLLTGIIIFAIYK